MKDSPFLKHIRDQTLKKLDDKLKRNHRESIVRLAQFIIGLIIVMALINNPDIF